MIDTHTHLYMAEYDVDGQAEGSLEGQCAAVDRAVAAGVDMMVLSAAVIGGTSLGGGKGTILGTTLGIVMLSIMNNALVLFNISVNWQNFVSGAILLIAIIIDYISNRQQTKRR